MARVYVGLGSNVEREIRIREAVEALRQSFGEIELSPVYDTLAVGFEGDNFLNLVAALDTGQAVQDVAAEFHDIENRLGRDRRGPRFGNRAIDLDILLYDDLILKEPGIRVPRPEILINAFVLKPLQDIAPERLHPETGLSFAEHWRAMAPGAPRMRRFPLDL